MKSHKFHPRPAFCVFQQRRAGEMTVDKQRDTRQHAGIRHARYNVVEFHQSNLQVTRKDPVVCATDRVTYIGQRPGDLEVMNPDCAL